MRHVLRLFITLLCLLAIVGCAGPPGQTAAAATATVPVTRGDLQASVSGSGSVQPLRTVNLSFATNGVVRRVGVSAGQQVPAGRELATLDPADLDQQVNQAQANHQRAVIQEQNLGEKATDADRRLAAANTRAFEAQLKLATQNRAKAILRAPFAGLITEVGIVPGESSAQKVAFTIVDTSTLHVDATISETDITRIERGLPVVVTFDALPTVSVSGTLDYIAPAATVQQNLTTYAVRVPLTNPDPSIRLGMTANIAVVMEERKGVLQLPIEAVRTVDGRSVVTVQRGEQTAEVPVETGLSTDVNIEIRSGLNENDAVVLGTETQ